MLDKVCLRTFTDTRKAVIDSFSCIGFRQSKEYTVNVNLILGSKVMMLTKGCRIILTLVLVLSFLCNAAQGEAAAKYKRTIEKYKVPEVVLVNQDGKKIDLKSYLDADKPVILDFIYGTCTTICPILSISFSNFQKKLGANVDKVRLVSISIDPDNDTPPVMKEYMERYNAREGWDFLTGKREDVIAVMKAFDAYVVNKMNHYPLTILRAPGEEDWVRINELLATSDLMREYNMLLK